MRQSSDAADRSRSADRRKDERYTLILRAGVLEQAGRTSLCLVKNISAAGIQLKFYGTPALNSPASIRVADEAPVDGHIIWIKDDVAGMSFIDPLESATLLRLRQKLKPNRRRTMPRVEVDASATLRSGGIVARAVVTDISSLGARVRTNSRMKAGDRAILEFLDMPPLHAFVRWSESDESGLAFETPIPMQIIARWIGTRCRFTV